MVMVVVRCHVIRSHGLRFGLEFITMSSSISARYVTVNELAMSRLQRLRELAAAELPMLKSFLEFWVLGVAWVVRNRIVLNVVAKQLSRCFVRRLMIMVT